MKETPVKVAKNALPAVVLPPEAGAESPEEKAHEGRGTRR